jgi:hypothetical protein
MANEVYDEPETVALPSATTVSAREMTRRTDMGRIMINESPAVTMARMTQAGSDADITLGILNVEKLARKSAARPTTATEDRRAIAIALKVSLLYKRL